MTPRSTTPAGTSSATPRAAASSGAHIPALDGVRGIAILLVMFHHMTILTGTALVDRAVARSGEMGWIGVDLFFVLSGFLITGILYDAKGGAHFFRNFYARRTLRIFPLYYAVVFFSLVVLPHIPNPKAANFGRIAGDEIWYWLYLSNFIIGVRHAFRHGILDISWSLAIEEQFYLVWPAVVLLLGRRGLIRACVVGLVVALAVRVAMVATGVHWIATYVVTPARVDGLLVGALIALVARGPAGLAPLARWARPVAAGAALVVAAIVVAQPEPFREGALGPTLGYSALALFFGALLVMALAARPAGALPRVLSHPWLRAFGKYSYALYLFHLPLRAVVRDLAYGPSRFLTVAGSQLPGQIIFYAASISLTFLAALLSWNLYEKHFLALKRFFPEARRRRRPADDDAGSGAPRAIVPGAESPA